MAVNGNTLYADSYIDLLSFNISSITNITLANRAQSALPYNCSSNGYYADSSQGVVIAWQKKMVTQKVNENCSGYGGSVGVVDPLMYNGATGLTTTGSSAATYGSSATPGVGGSTSRFTIAANTLYVVDYTALHVFDISNISPAHINDYNLGWSIETIFPFNNHLYIGSSSGFYIYDISNPQSPAYVSEYSHITACDPVVVDNHYAYFTLNSDYPCHKSVNELDVVDISNQQNPTLVTTVPMSSPRGLGVDAQTLFICDNKDGLKVYNTSDINNLQSNMVAHFSNINAFDVIPYNKHLVMTGSNGIYQYDYTNLQNITLLSSIPVSLN
jgi:hypothetical protein